jgi:hypothetical protein
MSPLTRYLILAVISKGIVELWEALMTLALFPTFVLIAWMVERKFFHRLLHCLSCLKTQKAQGLQTEWDGEKPLKNKTFKKKFQ